MAQRFVIAFVKRYSVLQPFNKFEDNMTSTQTNLTRYQMFIDGEWVDATSGETFQSDNPYTGKPWASIPRGNQQDADRAVRAAQRAFTSGEWPKLTATRRGALSRKSRLGNS